jgi:hypothetical protein
MLSSRRCCKPLGPPAAVFLLVASGEVQLCVSGDIYAEYEEVVRRPRLARDKEIITTTLQTIREKGFWVRPIRISRSRGLFGDRQSQALPTEWAGTLIFTPRRFLDFLSEEAAPTHGEPRSS